MPKIMLLGAQKVTSQLQGKSLSGNLSLKVKVGYGNLPYALKQHEDLSLNHPNGGEAKFLEKPARSMRKEMRDVIFHKLKIGKRSLEDALTAAGYLLIEASQLLVPVDTGALRDSGFVRID